MLSTKIDFLSWFSENFKCLLFLFLISISLTIHSITQHHILLREVENLEFRLIIFNADEIPQRINSNRSGILFSYFYIYINLYYLKIWLKNLKGVEIITFESCFFHSLKPGYIDLKNVKIRDVSSHYRKGWFYLCIIVHNRNKENTERLNQPCKRQYEAVINQKFKIKPLILGNIFVKSKKKKIIS